MHYWDRVEFYELNPRIISAENREETHNKLSDLIHNIQLYTNSELLQELKALNR